MKQSLVERWLLLWLCLSSLVAYLWTRLFPGAFDPFVASRSSLVYLIAGIMFAIGCLLPRDEVQRLARRWPTVLIGTILQYTTMPLLAYILGLLFVRDRNLFIGLMLVGCVPGAMASNVLTLAARGNVSYSISLTTLATILSPLVVPFTLYLTLHTRANVDPWETFRTLMWTVVLPVIGGYLICRFSPSFAAIMKRWGPVLANLLILWVIAVVVGINRDRLGQTTVLMAALLLLLNVLGYAAGYFGSGCLRFPEPMRRALTIEIGMQNAGLGAALATRLFEDCPTATIPPALYTFGCMLTGTILAHWWSRRQPLAKIG